MRKQIATLGLAVAIGASALAFADKAAANDEGAQAAKQEKINVQLGPRPFFLINDMDNSPLKRKLKQCENKTFKPSSFSIGHRGAPLQFPEHTVESYEAAARMGAGVLECDVAFTKDLELVCRHAQNDLHTTTNILLTPLAKKCTKPFTPAVLDENGAVVTPASAECRTSDITLAEFKTLRGKMDASNRAAKTVEEYQGGTPDFRTDLYAGPTSGHLLTHAESIELFKKLGVKMTPELKSPVVPMPFRGFTQAEYAQKLVDEYRAAGVKAKDVFPQSFDKNDVIYWVQNEPAFGRQAVYLDDANTVADLPTAAELEGYRQEGIRIWAPPSFALLDVNAKNEIVASQAAKNAKAAGLDIITWSLERSGVLANLNGDFYYQTVENAITREGDLMTVIDVLARDVGVRAIFSDWAAPVSYYANCMNIK
ncbi:glycerophosphodiester phosphodiesterase family protein [Hansschlegelia zhihuaiae]|uniref:glycerophosphodiester phosphodiesterase n=1 Tax=Hansschlegelia zhihuaiae TaxID=405005 RepID=A0A4Q0MIN9_9HYPH|nr:glycerophosphodiester phosphodiesterase family protein [Hansschlegelia zhihuaiae]RXF73531.1 glycerophosphodiester phosphodiesterase [Hansschlegelia zhihuaiae]